MFVLKLLGITLLSAAVFLYDFSIVDPKKKKERAAIAVITCAGWVVAVLLLFAPGLPGPTEWINQVTKPIWIIFYPEG
ncbi:hypothetical protein FHS19_001389 [Paenibacillus rhizosphaerae]|uniref:Uncharacterized protein n=1 Tax=Paenibacillus rhizosphaerae TaxID=297318 RepID=A0A839TIV3_9BACL|nr:hypothetical protein [Paenibacillus rhizosphaerae]MBB3126735.1 hypothetical protein [Paenibacillus rhizosphaerae]